MDNKLHYKIDYFYANFIKKHKYFDSLEGKNRRQKVVTLKMYKKIVSTFFTIYFYEAFYLDRPMYFILSGKIIRVRTTEFITMANNKIKPVITVLWFLRPLFSLAKCRIAMVTGSTNIIPKIRREWTSQNDLGMLPIIMVKKKEILDNKLMYLKDDKRNIFFRKNN